jgi:putative phosphoesterase
LSDSDKEYLRRLPITEDIQVAGSRFHLAHAAPNGDLYAYHITPAADLATLEKEVDGIDADFILLGHTHLPLLRTINGKTIVNPGSIGQPRHGDSRLSYAVWEDGHIKFHRLSYDVNRTVNLLKKAPLSEPVISQLTEILRTGGAKAYP